MAASSSKRRNSDKTSSSSRKNKDFALHKKLAERASNLHNSKQSSRNNSNSTHNNESGSGGGSGSNSMNRHSSNGSSKSRNSQSSNHNSNSHNNSGGGGSGSNSGGSSGHKSNHHNHDSHHGNNHHHSNNSSSFHKNRNDNHHNSSSDNHHHNSSNPSSHQNTTIRKPLDPTLLARGMTARNVGSRVSSSIKPLSNFEMEKDLRHMEAYGSACIAYAQQFFAFTNRELVNRGHFGPNAVAGSTGVVPGVSYSDNTLLGGKDGESGDGNTGASSTNTGAGATGSGPNGPTQNSLQHNGIHLVGMGGITMPVRIDPEEEKRLAILRNRVAASEAKREILETEYLSLRAHYVHESHKVRRARGVMTGQLNLLKDLVQKRGDLLSFHRVRHAFVNDVLHCLEYRSGALKKKNDDASNASSANLNADANTNTNMNVDEGMMDVSTPAPTNTDSDVGTNTGTSADTGISALTSASTNLTTPATATPSSSVGGTGTSTDPSTTENEDSAAPSPMEGVEKDSPTLNGSTTPSPKDEKMDGNDDDSNTKKTATTTNLHNGDLSQVWNMLETKLQEAELACINNVETPEELLQVKAALAADAVALEAATEKAALGNGSVFQRRSRSPARNDDDDDTKSGSATSSKKKNSEKSSKIKKGSATAAAAAASSTDENTAEKGEGSTSSKNNAKVDTDPNLIPWDCPIMPRTPYDVAILLSNLSNAADGASAFACGDKDGNSSDTLLWLEGNLPKSQNGEMDEEEEKLRRVREQVKALSEELSNEIKANSDLQRNIIKGRKRRDQLCSMMSMIRSETEAVIERYNEVLQTPEVMSELLALHADDEDEDLNESIDYQGMEDIDDYDEGELGDGENSEEGTVIADEDEGEEHADNQIDFGGVSNLIDSASDAYDDDNGGQPMKEIIVRMGHGEGNQSVDPKNPHNSIAKRGYAVATEDSTVDPEKKRRKV